MVPSSFLAARAGKSTWIGIRFPQAHPVDLLNEALFQSYLADIGRFATNLAALPTGTTVVVDKVRRLPALLNEVHRGTSSTAGCTSSSAA